MPVKIQVPLTIIPRGANAGNWKWFFQARFDNEPTNEDVYAASKSIGFGDISKRKGGYILKVENIKEITDSKFEEENGLWLAQWSAIPD